jgi:hypothetical protein
MAVIAAVVAWTVVVEVGADKFAVATWASLVAGIARASALAGEALPAEGVARAAGVAVDRVDGVVIAWTEGRCCVFCNCVACSIAWIMIVVRSELAGSEPVLAAVDVALLFGVPVSRATACGVAALPEEAVADAVIVVSVGKLA